jgi:thioredoxin-like negative regulator of GroEL
MSLEQSRVDEWRAKVAADPSNYAVRMELAFALVSAKLDDEATTELLWLWQNRLDGDAYEPRFLARFIRQVVERHPPARAAFVELRERADLPTTPTASEFSAGPR